MELLKCDRCGERPGLLWTVMDKTHSTGYHYCYRCMKELEKEARRRKEIGLASMVYEEGVSMR
jgi:hypothetical protein